MPSMRTVASLGLAVGASWMAAGCSDAENPSGPNPEVAPVIMKESRSDGLSHARSLVQTRREGLRMRGYNADRLVEYLAIIPRDRRSDFAKALAGETPAIVATQPGSVGEALLSAARLNAAEREELRKELRGKLRGRG